MLFSRLILLGVLSLSLATLPARCHGLEFAEYAHVLFITESVYTINPAASAAPIGNSFGSLQAADLLVTQAAADAGLIANWDGQTPVFTALLSSETVHARDRATITGPVRNTAGELLAADFSDLWDGSLLTGVNYDQYGAPIPPVSFFWTGSNAVGVAASTANSWTEVAGQSVNIGFSSFTTDWFNKGLVSAAAANRLAAIGPMMLIDPADLDSDKDVDGADFLLWQRGFGTSAAQPKLVDGDANGDLDVDAADLAIWETNFGRRYGPLPGETALVTAIPEPAGAALALGWIAVLLSRRRLGCY